MAGFDIEHNKEVLENVVKSYYKKASDQVKKVLTSDGYSHIIQGVEISEDFTGIKIQLKQDVEYKGQNVIQLFAFGGQIKIKDELVNVSPNPIIRKYLGKSR